MGLHKLVWLGACASAVSTFPTAAIQRRGLVPSGGIEGQARVQPKSNHLEQQRLYLIWVSFRKIKNNLHCFSSLSWFTLLNQVS